MLTWAASASAANSSDAPRGKKAEFVGLPGIINVFEEHQSIEGKDLNTSAGLLTRMQLWSAEAGGVTWPINAG